MLLQKKIIIPEFFLGIVYQEQQFKEVLSSGVYYRWDWPNSLNIQTVDLRNTFAKGGLTSEQLDLVERYPNDFGHLVFAWETQEQELGLIYEGNTLRSIKPSGLRGAYWQSKDNKRFISIKKIDISQNYQVPADLVPILQGATDPFLKDAIQKCVAKYTVPSQCMGFMEVDGVKTGSLAEGNYMWWKANREIKVKLYDCRLQNMEVNGQEILTKDRVGLRVNLSAMWQISDANLVDNQLIDYKDYLYRELQLALRTVVSTQTLDELLLDKNLLNQQVKEIVAQKAIAYGITLQTVGARDIILPGDMKAILTQVVEAEKLAEANLIKRREETQATRSLLNTAKVMEGNAVLLRLKELEVLEKITSRINNLNVYGGLDGVMNDLVRLK